jgi:tetratricopeptide (TPR) repeat protein
MADNPRIEDLRRRVQKDPASIAFAQLAEEFRRAGQHQEAVDVCASGLAIHPTYLSARVTLGRALLELGRLDEAQAALETVLQSAPENLAAMRGLAEVHHRAGNLPEALTRYKAALTLARNDPDLEETVADLSRKVSPQPRAEPKDGLSFEQMTRELRAVAPAPAAPAHPAPAAQAPAAAATVDVPPIAIPRAASVATPVVPPPLPRPPLQSTAAPVDADLDRSRHVIAALEGWLAAIHVTRSDRHA